MTSRDTGSRGVASRWPVGERSTASGRQRRVDGSGGRLPRKVCTMCCCQPGNVWTRTSTNPVACMRVVRRLDPVEVQHAAPQVAVEVGGARAQLAHRDDHAPADERSRSACCARSRPPSTRGRPAGRPASGACRTCAGRRWLAEVAQQVGGEDAVVGAGDPRRRELVDVAVHEPHARRPRLAPRGASISVDASTAVISASGATSSSACVDAPVPQPRSSSRSPAPRSRRPIRRAVIRRCSW